MNTIANVKYVALEQPYPQTTRIVAVFVTQAGGAQPYLVSSVVIMTWTFSKSDVVGEAVDLCVVGVVCMDDDVRVLFAVAACARKAWISRVKSLE